MHHKQTKQQTQRFSLPGFLDKQGFSLWGFPVHKSQILTQIDMPAMVTSVKASLHNFLATPYQELSFYLSLSGSADYVLPKHRGTTLMLENTQLRINQDQIIHPKTCTKDHVVARGSVKSVKIKTFPCSQQACQGGNYCIHTSLFIKNSMFNHDQEQQTTLQHALKHHEYRWKPTSTMDENRGEPDAILAASLVSQMKLAICALDLRSKAHGID